MSPLIGQQPAANAAARSGGTGGVRRFLDQTPQAFAGGGLISTPVNTSGLGVPDFGPLTSRIANALGSRLGSALGKKLDKAIGSGGGNTAAAVRYGKANAGHPYVFGTLWDCSGFVSALHSVAKGEKPHRRYVTPDFHGDKAEGFTRGKKSNFMVGVNPNPGKSGHMAARINGINFESAGGVGTRYGESARGWNSPMFSWRGGLAKGGIFGGIKGDLPYDLIDPRGQRYDPLLRRATEMTPLRTQLFDEGGYLPPGLTLAMNGTGKPERIRTAPQEASLQQRAERPQRVTNHQYMGPDARELVRQMQEVERRQEIMDNLGGR